MTVVDANEISVCEPNRSRLHTKLEGEAARKHAADTTIMGANLPQVATTIERLELVCSSFTDPGNDWCEWRAYDVAGKLLAKRHVPGY